MNAGMSLVGGHRLQLQFRAIKNRLNLPVLYETNDQ